MLPGRYLRNFYFSLNNPICWRLLEICILNTERWNLIKRKYKQITEKWRYCICIVFVSHYTAAAAIVLERRESETKIKFWSDIFVSVRCGWWWQWRGQQRTEMVWCLWWPSVVSACSHALRNINKIKLLFELSIISWKYCSRM